MEIAIGFLWRTLLIAGIMVHVEYWIHRLTMHRRQWPLGWNYQTHHVEHHAQGNDTLSPHIDIVLIAYVIGLAPFYAIQFYRIFALDQTYVWQGVAALTFVMVSHRQMWNGMHRNIHNVKPNWTRYLPWYGWFCKNHLDHHAHTNYNFSVTFPVDWMYGTLWREPAKKIPSVKPIPGSKLRERENVEDHGVHTLDKGGRRRTR